MQRARLQIPAKARASRMKLDGSGVVSPSTGVLKFSVNPGALGASQPDAVLARGQTWD